MGGDDAPAAIVDGVARAARRGNGAHYLLHGCESEIAPLLEKHPDAAKVSEIRHSDTWVTMTDKPSEALRRARGSSMWNAVESVKHGEANVAISAGNTGALMAISKLALRTMPGIDRPALAALLPTLGDNDLVMLDLGANTECDARNLVQFAIMGAAYSRVVTGRAAPRVRLLNIGTEEIKGTDSLRDAASLLRDAADKGLRARIRDRSLRELAGEALAISEAGLKARARAAEFDVDEAHFLNDLKQVVETGETLSEEILRRWEGDWDRRFEPLFEEYSF